MKKARDRFDAELEQIHKELLQVDAGAPMRPSKLERSEERQDDLQNAEQRLTVASSELMAPAFQLAGYVVATLALGRSIPRTVALQADTEYDIGRCSESDLDTIWAVGHLAAERRRGDGSPWEPGPSIIIFKMESDSADEAATDRDQRAKRILDENWDDIVRVARLLIDRRTLSSAEIEAEIFEPDEAPTPPERLT